MYSCTFLFLNTSEIRILDIRTDLHGKNCITSVSEYIKTHNPDYVLVLYSALAAHYTGEEMVQHYNFN